MFHLYRGSCDDGRAFVEADRVLDRAAGPRWLSQPAVAGCVVRHILENDGSDYQVHAFVVMPNHVHVLLEPWIELSAITRTTKGRSARQANLILGTTGQRFWQDESFDHWVRNELEFSRTVQYIEHNPVTAGLVERPEDWPWSSATLRS